MFKKKKELRKKKKKKKKLSGSKVRSHSFRSWRWSMPSIREISISRAKIQIGGQMERDLWVFSVAMAGGGRCARSSMTSAQWLTLGNQCVVEVGSSVADLGGVSLQWEWRESIVPFLDRVRRWFHTLHRMLELPTRGRDIKVPMPRSQLSPLIPEPWS